MPRLRAARPPQRATTQSIYVARPRPPRAAPAAVSVWRANPWALQAAFFTQLSELLAGQPLTDYTFPPVFKKLCKKFGAPAWFFMTDPALPEWDHLAQAWYERVPMHHHQRSALVPAGQQGWIPHRRDFERIKRVAGYWIPAGMTEFPVELIEIEPDPRAVYPPGLPEHTPLYWVRRHALSEIRGWDWSRVTLHYTPGDQQPARPPRTVALECFPSLMSAVQIFYQRRDYTERRWEEEEED